MLNNVNVNPHIFLDSNNCKIIATPLQLDTDFANSTFNNPNYFEQTAHGFFVYQNSVRLGFASDFALLIKKNLRPIPAADGVLYNEWVRLNCFSSISMCFSEDNLLVNAAADRYDGMLRNQKVLLHPIRLI